MGINKKEEEESMKERTKNIKINKNKNRKLRKNMVVEMSASYTGHYLYPILIHPKKKRKRLK